MQNIMKKIFLSLFVLSLFITPADVSATANYSPGSLIKLKGVRGAAVYQIGSDGHKYIFPDQRTFNTWYDDFSDVVEVEQDDLDQYEDGGTVTFQPGTRLITHRNTARVYAVGEDGQLYHVPDEATALRLYGQNWGELVSDIDPGVFAIAYRIAHQTLSEDNLPEGSLVEDETTGNYYLIEDGEKRLVLPALIKAKNLHRKHIIKIKRLANIYDQGTDVDDDDDDVAIFDPREKIILCHKPGVANVTIRVSSRALAAHLAHGDTRGACTGDTNDDDTATSTIDIKVDDIKFEPSSPFVNTTTTITAYIKNSGSISLSNPTPIFNILTSLSDYSVSTVTTSTVSTNDPLVAGESATIVWTGYFPSTGPKTIAVTADYADSLEESNENNNTRFALVTVVEKETDLSIESLVVEPSDLTVGEEAIITLTIKNNGDTSLTDTAGILNYLVSFENFQETEDVTNPVISDSNPFEPQETLEVVWTGYFSSAGDKDLEVTIDQSNQLSEANENNNTITDTITIYQI